MEKFDEAALLLEELRTIFSSDDVGDYSLSLRSKMLKLIKERRLWFLARVSKDHSLGKAGEYSGAVDS
jgi:hypothetical protein